MEGRPASLFQLEHFNMPATFGNGPEMIGEDRLNLRKGDFGNGCRETLKGIAPLMAKLGMSGDCYAGFCRGKVGRDS